VQQNCEKRLAGIFSYSLPDNNKIIELPDSCVGVYLQRATTTVAYFALKMPVYYYSKWQIVHQPFYAQSIQMIINTSGLTGIYEGKFNLKKIMINHGMQLLTLPAAIDIVFDRFQRSFKERFSYNKSMHFKDKLTCFG
jgi:hypothetical protein